MSEQNPYEPPGSEPPEPGPGEPPPSYEQGYPPPGYEQGYPPQGGYTQPPGGYAQQPERNNTQLFGILAIVLAIVCCPLLGILFGWLSMKEAKKFGSDDILGKVGFWLGIAFTALWVAGALIALCAGGMSGWNHGTRY
jgi:hypothetical protein